MRAHAQATNEYLGGEMSTEVVVDRNLFEMHISLHKLNTSGQTKTN